jgi:hypothetical protein
MISESQRLYWTYHVGYAGLDVLAAVASASLARTFSP